MTDEVDEYVRSMMGSTVPLGYSKAYEELADEADDDDPGFFRCPRCSFASIVPRRCPRCGGRCEE